MLERASPTSLRKEREFIAARVFAFAAHSGRRGARANTYASRAALGFRAPSLRRDGTLEGPHLLLLRCGRGYLVLRQQPSDEAPSARHDAPSRSVVRPAQAHGGLRTCIPLDRSHVFAFETLASSSPSCRAFLAVPACRDRRRPRAFPARVSSILTSPPPSPPNA